MWNLTPDSLQLAKEELKGRKAALEARYADEMKTITSDLEEIETLERVAYAFAVKHLTPVNLSDAAATTVELAPLESGAAESPPNDLRAKEPLRETSPRPSRWRIRTDAADA